MEAGTEHYLLYVSLGHVNVSIHLVKVMLCSVSLLAIPFKPSLTLEKTGQHKLFNLHDWCRII